MHLLPRRLLLTLSLQLVVVIGACSYGAAVIRYEIFPLGTLRVLTGFFEAATGSDAPPVSTVETNLVRIQERVLNHRNTAGLTGFGGGLDLLRGQALGVDAKGQFFLYPAPEGLQTFELGLSLNEPALRQHLATDAPDYDPTALLQVFRVLDLVVRHRGDVAEIYVSHHYWHQERLGKTTRVSRLIVDDVDALLEKRLPGSRQTWVVVFETEPLVPLDLSPSPFQSNHTGGRMALGEPSSLFLTVGDQDIDGVLVPQVAAQDPSSSYGKIFRIDLESETSQVYAVGLKNSQGLLIDRNGRIWATDHGPEGGDELNLIQEGANYGWPLVTHGTDYGSYEWPLNEHQGRHDGYPGPVYSWSPSIAISDVIQIDHGPTVWDGDLLIASYRGYLSRVRIREDRPILREQIVVRHRIRSLAQLPDGRVLGFTDSAFLIELTPTVRPS